MATQYFPLPRNYKQKWLLTNGRIVEEPSLETSESRRRVRVAGDDKSVYMKDLDDLIYRSVTQFATRQNERVWMRVLNDDPVQDLDNELGRTSAINQPHFITPQQNSYIGRASELTWTFRHETLPIAARITVEMSTPRRSYGNRDTTTELTTVKVSYPSTNPYDAFDRVWNEVERPESFPFSEHNNGVTGYEQQQQDYIDWLRASIPEWASVLGQERWGNEREAAAGIARICREIESFDSITIPDLRNPENPEWLELKLHSTTYSNDFARSLVDFINGQPVVEQVREKWNEIVQLLKRSGLVTKELEESDWHAALQGDTERVQVTLGPVQGGSQEQDSRHIIGLNLATGTLTVSCQVRDTNPDDITTEYEIARIKAETRGELNAFLGYQASFLDTHHDARHEQIVEQRTVTSDDLDELLQ